MKAIWYWGSTRVAVWMIMSTIVWVIGHVLGFPLWGFFLLGIVFGQLIPVLCTFVDEYAEPWRRYD